MQESDDKDIRIWALERQLVEEKARREAMEKRLVALEQSQAQRWYGAGSSS